MYKSNSKPMHVACVLIRPPPKYSSQDLPTLEIVDVVTRIIIVVDLIVIWQPQDLVLYQKQIYLASYS